MADYIVTPFEVDYMVQRIQLFMPNDILSFPWMQQHALIEKLNMQAHASAKSGHDEFVVDSICREAKPVVLLQNLLCIEFAKNRLALKLLKSMADSPTSIRANAFITNESIVLNFMEVLCYHRSTIEDFGDGLGELVDYIHRKLVKLINYIGKVKDEKVDTVKRGGEGEEEWKLRINENEFSVQLMCINVFRYITDHLTGAPLGLTHKIIEEYDFIEIICSLVDLKPWTRTSHKDQRVTWNLNRWEVVPKAEFSKVNQTEAQCWLAILNMFSNQEIRNNYGITSKRKNSLLKLRKYMSETLTDQIPPLQHLHRSLEELQLQDCPATFQNNKNFLAVESFPEILSHIQSEYKEEECVRLLLTRMLDKNPETVKSEYGLFGDVWNIDHLEMFEDPRCAECGGDAAKRCSKCKSEWYCSRECQVTHWKAHKEMCAILAKGLGEEKGKREDKKEQPKKKLVEVVE